jgi:hypothetical protein
MVSSSFLSYWSMLNHILDQQCKSLTQLNEKFAANGSVVHKFRISHKGLPSPKKSPKRSITNGLSSPRSQFLTQPSPSQDYELARALVATTTTGGAGVRMSVFGPFIQEVPSRIGHNAALDAAAAVLVNAHTSLVNKKSSTEIVSPHLYLRAIKILQTYLEDPQQGMSANTLCASVLLSLVEVSAFLDGVAPILTPSSGLSGSKDRESLLGTRWWCRSFDGVARPGKVPGPICEGDSTLQ